MVVRVDAKVGWQAFFDPDSDAWVAVCNELNLNAMGETWGELLAYISEAMEVLFRDLFQEGELPQFLREHGWTPMERIPGPGVESPRFDVPADITRVRREEIAV